MHVHFLDPYQRRSSPLHRLDPRVKLVLTLAYILTCALTPEGAWPVYVLLFALILSVEILSALSIRSVHRRALLALPFMLAALPVMFTSGGDSLLSLPVGSWEFTIYTQGLIRFISVALKSWLSVQAAVLLASSTPFPDLLYSLRAIRVPKLLVAMFGLMWRYLFVLADEAVRLTRARAARSGVGSETDGRGRKVRHGGTLSWRARVTGGMAGNLFLRAFERSDRIYMAMVARGYDGETLSLPQLPVSPSAWRVLASGLIVLFLLLLSAIMFWGR